MSVLNQSLPNEVQLYARSTEGGVSQYLSSILTLSAIILSSVVLYLISWFHSSGDHPFPSIFDQLCPISMSFLGTLSPLPWLYWIEYTQFLFMFSSQWNLVWKIYIQRLEVLSNTILMLYEAHKRNPFRYSLYVWKTMAEFLLLSSTILSLFMKADVKFVRYLLFKFFFSDADHFL